MISEKTNTIVNNRGVGGYGTDQAFLKYINSRSEGNIVVLNHLSENIIRNVNQFRHLIYPGKSFDLKPVFISANDSLKLIEIPDIHNENFKNFQENPNEFLKHDFFKIGSQSGIYNKRFPFSFTLFKSFLSNWKITSQLNYFSGYQPFYDKNHSSGALEITKLIIEEFNTDVIKNNSKPIITIIPTYRDFEYFEKYGIFPYQTLIEELNDKIELIDFGMEFLSEINSLDMDILLDLYIEPAGHMNEKGHYLLSKVFVKYLIINNYL